MRISKKILACVLAALMAISMMPFTASAETIGIAPSASKLEYSADDADELFDSIDDADAAATIEFTNDIVVTEPVVIEAGKIIKFDLNGHSLSGNIQDSDGKKLIQVSGELEFVGDGGCIYNTNTAGQGHAACQALTGGTIFVNAPINFGDSDTDMTNANNTNRGCGIQNNGGTLIINNGYYTAIDANYSTGAWAYAILNCAGDTVVNNATVYGNGLHGALGCESGTLTVNDGTFAVNGANNYYSLYVDGGVTTVNGGTFTNNGKYGVNYLGTGAETSINGGTFTYTVPFVVSGSKGNPVVSGGTFSGDVSAYLADGCSQDANGAVALAGVAKINSTYYATLDAAVSAAKSGDTITLVADVDTTADHHGVYEFYYYDISGVTLDLNGHSINERTYSVAFIGVNGTIKNGTIICTPDSDSRFYFAIGCDMDANPMRTTDNIVLEDLTVNAGLHVSECSNVVAKNCDVTGRNYYAVWGDPAGELIIEGGNYESVDGKALFGTLSDPYDDSYITVKSGNFTVPNGKKLVLEPGGAYVAPQNVTVKGGTYHYANGNVCTVLARNLAENCTQDMETGSVTQGAANDGANISVTDEIVQNFYIDADFYGQESYATLEYNHASNASEEPDVRTDTVQLKDLPALNDAGNAYDGARMLSVIQAPAQSTEAIVINIYNTAEDAAAEENAVKTIEYSVYTYCSTIINTSTDEGLKDLAKATLDYAAAAQEYFSYNEGNMATKDNGGYYGDVANVNLSSVTGITSRPAEIKNVTVVVKSDLEINLLSKTPVAVNSFSWDATSGGSRFGVSALDEPNGSWYVINIKGIEPANMDSTITINTNGVPIELSANSIMKIMANSSNAKMATLAKAMYLYGQAANAYFD